MKRKVLSSAVHARLSKVVRLADFGRVVQSKIAEAIVRRANLKAVGGVLEVKDLYAIAAERKVSNGELENFKVCLRHHRDALRETANFLQYYNDRKVHRTLLKCSILINDASHQGALVSEKVALEVLDMEKVFGFFREGYGDDAMDVIRCSLCGKSHKSVQN